jgi:hypothetical protein
MEKEIKTNVSLDKHLGCFGRFRISDPICKKYCALNLRCAIESDQKEQLEILEDLVSSGTINTRSH